MNRIKKPKLVLGGMLRRWQRYIPTKSRLRAWFGLFKNARVRMFMGTMAALIVIAELVTVLQPFMIPHAYALGAGANLLPPVNEVFATKLKYDDKQKSFVFNQGPAYDAKTTADSGHAQITATAYADPSKGLVVTDSTNKVDLTMKPKFWLWQGEKDGNRVVYPLAYGNGWLVYTMQSTGVKEDILLDSSDKDSLTFDYSFNLGSSLRAQVNTDGSIGVYGSTMLSGNVATASDADAALLQKARQQAPKNTLLFSIPAPVIKEIGKQKSDVKAHYSLNGDTLRMTVDGLKAARYPLTIDPSIYVETAEKFMRGNNETNIDFDVANTLIQKGKTTGARFNSWNNTTTLPSGTWDGGTVAAGGYVYSAGGVALNGQVFSGQGSGTYTVPAGVTSITTKIWGGGGGGGGGGAAGGTGAAGGGGGYITAVLTVTPGEDLTVYVGGGGSGGNYSSGGNDAGGGGGGGGYSSLYRSSTPLAIAGGGAGGGGARQADDGGAGGPGGCTSSGATCNGTTVGNGGGGAGATNSAGGAGGSGGNNGGSAGTSLTGGAGADGRSSAGTDGSGAAGGLASGGDGGQPNINTTRPGGGGGGAGYFGGGGGGSTTSATTNAGGGGGGGSNFNDAGATSVTNNIGSGATPGNSSDGFRNGAAGGGAGGAALGNGSDGSNGIVILYVTGSTYTTSQSVNWAKFNTSSGAIDSPNPGSGSCSGWCTTSAYNLPAARAGFSMVAYNGFLYVLGGINSGGTLQNTVYIAKIGANGEPQLWHPTDTNKNNWVYWFTSANTLPDNIAYGSAVAYNNRMYILGGKSTTNATGDAIVRVTDLKPTGDIGSWSSTGMTQLSSGSTARFGLTAQVYNDRIYVIGGNNAGTLKNDVFYMKLNTDGTMASSTWTATKSFGTARMSWGGNFSAVWGAYIYISGGCTAVNGSGYCTTIASDTQLASINADGSIDVWNTNASVSDQRMGYGLPGSGWLHR
jgi:hypothetical protein